MKNNNIFLKSALVEIPRLLGHLNRNPSSASYGSFDRSYWHYRTHDISSARLQEAVLTLALLYKNNFEGNIYYKDQRLFEWIVAVLDFTFSLQHKDGSYDEWYKNEKAFVATAFVTAAFAETALILGKEYANYNKLIGSLKKSADWLIDNIPSDIPLNQLSGGIFAIAAVFSLTKEEKYKQQARRLQKEFMEKQSKEGWWSEYGGPDIGYLSLLIDYFSKYYKIIPDQSVIESLTKAISFLSYFLHPNGTAGGEYASRNTEYLIPSGFVSLSKKIKGASNIVSFIIFMLEKEQGVLPRNLDERYLCYNLYTWLQAGLSYDSVSEIYSPVEFSDVYFSDAGIRIVKTSSYVCICNLRKGGMFRIYTKDGDRNVLDSGIEFLYQGKMLSSQGIDISNKIDSELGRAYVEGFMKYIKEPLMSTAVMLVFKSFQFFAGILPVFINRSLKKFIRKKIITGTPKSTIIFKRTFMFDSSSVTVTDEIGAKISTKEIKTGNKASYTFVPSSKLFSVQELAKYNLIPATVENKELETKTLISRKFEVL